MKSKFDFYEIVKIITDKPDCAQLNGKLGVIRGKAHNEETGKWTYGVSIYSDDGLVSHVDEKDIYPTGKKADPKDHYTGETMKVRVNPKTGKGYLVDPEEK